MNVSFQHAVAAMDNASRWQELIAQNLAGSSIPGFKKQELSFQAVQGAQPAASATSLNLATPVAMTNFAQGDFRHTGVPTDLALDGPAFFQVQLPNGATAFTRNGEFHVNAQGEFVTKEGYSVLGEAGPIQTDVRNPAPLSINADGLIAQGAEVKGRLALTQWMNPGKLTPITGSYFLASDPGLVPADSTSSVRQGFLETANTSSASEMVSLIAALRHFEANQRVVNITDERMSRAIHDLGNPS